MKEDFIDSPAMQTLRESQKTGKPPKDAVFRNGKWEPLNKPYEPEYTITDRFGNRIK